MWKMIMVPEERWDRMMQIYDALVQEMEETKKALREAATSKRASNLETT